MPNSLPAKFNASYGRYVLCIIFIKGKGKIVSLCFNLLPRHEVVLGEWRYSFTRS
jgi:hypothetical protein